MTTDNEAETFSGDELTALLEYYIDNPEMLHRGEDRQRKMLKSARYEILRLRGVILHREFVSLSEAINKARNA